MDRYRLFHTPPCQTCSLSRPLFISRILILEGYRSKGLRDGEKNPIGPLPLVSLFVGADPNIQRTIGAKRDSQDRRQ
jgi:hypothetical protein